LELGDSYLNGSVQNIPHKVAIKLQELGWIQRNSIVCHRSNPRPSSSKNNLTNTYSMMFHFTKSMDYRYERTLTKISSNTKPSHPPRHRSSDGSTVKSLTPYIPNIDGKNIGDFLSDDILRTAVSNQKNYNGIKEHPAQFPEQLVWLVLNSVCVLPFKNIPTSSPLVLDIFGGSLSVNRVIQMINKMENTNIRFVGYDIKKWF
jgi:DNA modification methylase